MRGAKSVNIEILEWELAKAWKLKSEAWRWSADGVVSPYEKQGHLHFSENLLKEADMADLDSHFFRAHIWFQFSGPRLHACIAAISFLATLMLCTLKEC